MQVRKGHPWWLVVGVIVELAGVARVIALVWNMTWGSGETSLSNIEPSDSLVALMLVAMVPLAFQLKSLSFQGQVLFFICLAFVVGLALLRIAWHLLASFVH